MFNFKVFRSPTSSPALTAGQLSKPLNKSLNKSFNRIIFGVAVSASMAVMATLSACNIGSKDAKPDPAQIRVVHASADAGSVDVIVGSTTLATGAPYGAATAFTSIDAGSQTVKVNATTVTATSLISATLNLETKKLYTVIAADRLNKIAPIVVTEDATAPTAGNIKIRVVHASPVAGNVDIYVTTPTAALAATAPTLSNVPFKTVADVLQIPGGAYRIRITAAGSKTAVFDSGSATFATGSDLLVLAVDRNSGPSPVSLLVLTRTPATPRLDLVDNRAEVQVLHASPDAGNVDVLVNDQIALTNMPYPTASAYLPLAAGAQNFKVNATGTSTPVINATPTLAPATSYTLVAANLLASIQPLVFENKLTFPASDKALIRVIHASPDLNSADVSANGTNIATATTFKTATEYLSVTAGAFTLKVTATVTVAGTATAVGITDVATTLQGGKIYTAVLIGSVATAATNPVKLILLTDR